MSNQKHGPLIDIGVNLLNKRFAEDLDEVIYQAQEAGVMAMIVTGTDVTISEQARHLCDNWSGILFHTGGCHPHHADEFSDTERHRLETLVATSPSLVAIGECGLDYYRNFSSPKKQRDVFGQQLALAAAARRPVFTHLRDAAEDFIAMVREYRYDLVGVCVHCFTDGPEVLEKLLALDCYIGVTGWICDERRNRALKEALPKIPDDRLLLETDAPYLLPRTLSKKPKNGRNEPKFLAHICEYVANLRGQNPQNLATMTTQNAMRFFNLRLEDERDL